MRWSQAVAGVALATALTTLPRPARADRAAYDAVVDLQAEGHDFVVKHHHDWSPATRDDRHRMIATHQDPFRVDNSYASLAWYSRDGKTLLRKMPSPALTWLGVTADSRYVVGLSRVKLDNPIQLVVYDTAGALLLARHITPRAACLEPERYQDLRRRYPRQLEALGHDRVWTQNGLVYADFMSMDMPRRLGPLWEELLRAECPSPLSPSFTESVTNYVYWYDLRNPAPEVVEEGGRPVRLRLRDPKGAPFDVQFRLRAP